MSRLRIWARARARGWLFLAVFGVSNTGCSLIFVKEPSAPRPRDCTSSSFAPVLDSVFAGYQVVRTGAALTADDEVYEDAAINRSADVALGIGFTTLFVASAAYGFVTTSKCDKFKRGEGPAEEDDSDPWAQGDAAGPAAGATPTGVTYRGRGRAPASLAPAASPSASAPAVPRESASPPPAPPASNAPAAASSTAPTPTPAATAAPTLTPAPAEPGADDTAQ